jgi:hypothetical protein
LIVQAGLGTSIVTTTGFSEGVLEPKEWQLITMLKQRKRVFKWTMMKNRSEGLPLLESFLEKERDGAPIKNF